MLWCCLHCWFLVCLVVVIIIAVMLLILQASYVVGWLDFWSLAISKCNKCHCVLIINLIILILYQPTIVYNTIQEDKATMILVLFRCLLIFSAMNEIITCVVNRATSSGSNCTFTQVKQAIENYLTTMTYLASNMTLFNSCTGNVNN